MRHLVSPRAAFAFGLAVLAASARPAIAQPALAATPAAVVVSTEPGIAPGVYRIALDNGRETVHARVVMERIDGALEGTVLIEATASALIQVRAENGEVRANMLTSDGRGELVLRQTDGGVAGSLKVGKMTWAISGQRSV